MKDNHPPGPTIHRFIYYSPGRRIDHQFVELGYYQRQSDLLGECLEALHNIRAEIACLENPTITELRVYGIAVEAIDKAKGIPKAILTKRKGGSYEEKSMFQMR